MAAYLFRDGCIEGEAKGNSVPRHGVGPRCKRKPARGMTGAHTVWRDYLHNFKEIAVLTDYFRRSGVLEQAAPQAAPALVLV
ncbi:hypothetical protein [Orrella dioscoreae]|uniref:hypothetical protein n=1 Tax=Orrella dioscoreae TaxID=1851544 RepID=UPI0012FFD6E9|nr:hypothetical protein [Orrella dioscoreae]